MVSTATTSGRSQRTFSSAAGERIPAVLLQEPPKGSGATLAAPAVLARVRKAWDGPMLVPKGPELAGRYPKARRLNDLGLLVREAEAVQRALIVAGFVEFPLDRANGGALLTGYSGDDLLDNHR